MTAAVNAPAAPATPDCIVRIHFAGAGQVSAGTNAVAFTKLWCSPEALAPHQQLDMQSAAGKWLAAIGPTLGNTVAAVTQTAPNELSYKRSAPGGLTAIELLALANWLEAPNFPGCDLRLPSPKRWHPLPQIPGPAPAKTPAAPPPFPSH